MKRAISSKVVFIFSPLFFSLCSPSCRPQEESKRRITMQLVLQFLVFGVCNKSYEFSGFSLKPTTVFAALIHFDLPVLPRRLLLMLLVYEACIGLYFPAMATCRSKYIDDRLRGTIMNITRYGTVVLVHGPSPIAVLACTNVQSITSNCGVRS